MKVVGDVRVVIWLKPFLSPLYSWSAALDRSTVATAPKLVRLVLHFIGRQLERHDFRYTCSRLKKLQDERFRSELGGLGRTRDVYG